MHRFAMTWRSVRHARVWLLSLSACLVSGVLSAQTPEPPADDAATTAASELTGDVVQARLAKLQENKDLDAALKMRLFETYGKVLEFLKAAGDATARNDRFARQTREAPQTLQTLQRELSEPVAELPLDLPTDATLPQGQQRLSQVEADLADAQKTLKEWQDEPKRRTDRRAEIPKLAEAAKQQLQDLEQQLQAKPSPDDSPETAAANHWLLEARKAAIIAEAAAAQAELRLYETAGELLPVRRDLAARKAAQLDSLAKRVRDDVNERRRREAEQQAREARRVAAQAHPALRAIAERNAELAKLRQSLALQIEGAVRDLDVMNSRVAQLSDQFAKISKRVETGQHRQAIGLLLRKQRDELPNVSSERRRIQSRSGEIAAASLQLIELEDERSDLATLDKRLNEVLGGITQEERFLLEDDVREMLQTQRNYLDAIIVDTNGFLDKLVEENAREQELIGKARDYAEYCDERILWICSAQSLGALQPADFAPAFEWLALPQNWRSVGETLWSESATRPWSSLLLALSWVLCLIARSRLRSVLCQCGDQAVRHTCRTILPTVQAVPLTLILASPWPALCAIVGLRLASAEPPAEFAHALGEGLVSVSLLFAALEILRQVCRPRGLAESHFAWNSDSLRKVRRGVFWMTWVGLPLALVVLVTESQSNEAIKSTLGRMAFVALNVLLLAPAFQAARLDAGVLTPAYRQEPTAWWSRLCWLWLAIAFGGPVSLLGLAVAGFYYTAAQLAGHMLITGWLVIGLIAVYGLLLRWSLIAYRNLGMQRLQVRRAAAAEAAAASAPQPANTQLEIKLSDINQQTRNMLQLVLATALAAGVWWIWGAVVPAFGVLRHVVLWTLESRAPGVDEIVRTPITLADLLLSLVVLALSMAVSRNIPSLLELTLLKRLPMDAGARYATATITKYAISALGIVVAFGSLGLQWSQVQWLVAAVSVGLGFGLQEIFANFVSGLVLLFERPIRMGDIVTVGDIDGKVTNIDLRATTITDWDLREMIVPNKEFITGRVINWTLSNTMSRMSIEVGVAYGADPDQVRELLLDAARKHPLALKDPAPHALLDKFADSTLNFILRVYIPNRDVYLQLRHELMTQIAAGFNQAGIVFAFPQCDIHLDYPGAPITTLQQLTDSMLTAGPHRTQPRSKPAGAPAVAKASGG